MLHQVRGLALAATFVSDTWCNQLARTCGCLPPPTPIAMHPVALMCTLYVATVRTGEQDGVVSNAATCLGQAAQDSCQHSCAQSLHNDAHTVQWCQSAVLQTSSKVRDLHKTIRKCLCMHLYSYTSSLQTQGRGMQERGGGMQGKDAMLPCCATLLT